MKENLFVVILKYIVSLDKIDSYRPRHLEFLDRHYALGTFIVSGRQVPGVGGVIIAKCSSNQQLEKILGDDPFAIYNLAEYQIYEFTPTRHLPCLNEILEE